ncbi:putative RING-H2 zinc finger [Trypanosoma cruzi]|nr:putative RING-H2 zinc finger [Trypanosoma cruzi]
MERTVLHGNASEDVSKTYEGDACSITAKQWDMVAVWSWNVQVGTCAICKSTIADLCIECCGMGGGISSGNTTSLADEGNNRNERDSLQRNRSSVVAEFKHEHEEHHPPPLGSAMATASLAWDGVLTGDCLIVWGVCNHVFHKHCISRWVRQRPQCPICGREWKVAKTTRNDI